MVKVFGLMTAAAVLGLVVCVPAYAQFGTGSSYGQPSGTVNFYNASGLPAGGGTYRSTSTGGRFDFHDQNYMPQGSATVTFGSGYSSYLNPGSTTGRVQFYDRNYMPQGGATFKFSTPAPSPSYGYGWQSYYQSPYSSSVGR